MSTVKSSVVIPKINLEPAKRCPDYDSDCQLIEDHAACWKGSDMEVGDYILHKDQADGYCPYLIGMKP